MKQILIWVCLISLFLLASTAKSDENDVKNALLQFIAKLTNSNGMPDPSSGWNSSSSPCKDRWRGVSCDSQHLVTKIILAGFNFSGVLDTRLLCRVQSLSSSLLVLNVSNNSIRFQNLEDIDKCFQLNDLSLAWNHFSGNLPYPISLLKNLQTLDVSHNEFSGPLPDLSQISGLTAFRADYNLFSGPIPAYNFSSFSEFNVSYNNLSGAIPDGAKRYKMDSFIHNPELCGPPLPNNCTSRASSKESPPAHPPTTSKENNNHGLSTDQILMFAGYALIALAVVVIVLLCLNKRRKKKQEKKQERRHNSDKKIAAIDDDGTITEPSFSTVEMKASKSEELSADLSGTVSQSMVVLTGLGSENNGMIFEELLQAPAEVLGRGIHGSVYKAEYKGMVLAVKRIRDWTISSSEFKQRMRRLNQVKHPNVLPAVAFYSSRNEKLLVYEYQKNGSLFKRIHADEATGNIKNHPFDWSSRLSVAATVADALAYMHEQLRSDCIPHGNLKSSNIFLNDNMEPCISEYGLMIVDPEDDQKIITSTAVLKSPVKTGTLFEDDTHAFGVILLELLTGRMHLNEGLDLAGWVVAVLREEWTVEVFDKKLIQAGASEERMVNVLQVALRCFASPAKRPTMREVALAIRATKEDDERSLDVSQLSTTNTSFVVDV